MQIFLNFRHNLGGMPFSESSHSLSPVMLMPCCFHGIMVKTWTRSKTMLQRTVEHG